MALNIENTPQTTETSTSFWDSISSFWDNLFTPDETESLSESVYGTTKVKPETEISFNTDDILKDRLQKAQKANAIGTGLKTAAAAGEFFNSIVGYSTGKDLASMQARNTKQAAKNQMEALDSQVLYYKNQMMDKFNTLLARNTVSMAAKNLKVTAASLLEQNKGTAHDINLDMRTLESNAELKKIALRSEMAQADVTKALTKKLLGANIISSSGNLLSTIGKGISSGGFSDMDSLFNND